MKEIQLTQGYVALIDDEDYERVSLYNWLIRNSRKDSNKIYAVTSIWITALHKSYYIRMHRFILNNNPLGLEVDHKDGNGLNNQKDNLRLCTRQQNAQNVKKKDGRDYKGVSTTRNPNKFRAYIKKDKRFYSLGYYNTRLEAALAYNKKAIELFGEYANLNII